MTFDFWIYFTILLASSGYGIFHFRKMPAWLRGVTLICLLTLISEVASRILERTIGNSSPPYHIYVVLCYLLQCYTYTKTYKNNRLVRNFCIASGIIMSIFSIINSFFLQDFFTLPSHAILLSSIGTLILTLSSFALMLQTPGKTPILKEAYFWFNVANLLLYTSTFFYLAFYNVLVASIGIPDAFENVIVVFTILTYLLYGISLYLGNKKNQNYANQ